MLAGETSDAAVVPLIQLDLRTASLETTLDPFSHWDELRRNHRAFRTDPPAESGEDIWVFTRYEDVRNATRDHDLLSNKAILGAPYRPVGDRKFGFVEMDSPEHEPWRRALAPFFGPRVTRGLDGQMREWCRGLIEEFRDDNKCEFITDFARVFPTMIFVGLMGLPMDDREMLVRESAFVTHATPERDPDGSRRELAVQRIEDYLQAVIHERKASPRENDTISALAQLQIDGCPASAEDVLGSVLVLFFGGLDTVSATLGCAWHYLARHPKQRELLRREPNLIPHAVEEFLRYFPVILPPRVVKRDAEYLSCPVKAGDRVIASIAAANRDETAFPNADQVIFDRPANRHLTFGVGAHRCLGSYIARAELAIALEIWHELIPDYRIPEGMFAAPAPRSRGFDNLPLEW